ncbi:MAG: thiol:disulfide interchange protein DsbA/DsbL [Gammaproteobacteria bacterium]|nr:thiol:disulfide interchange protein DsbA/DsbL [Gammaproteobacteria bacterium]
MMSLKRSFLLLALSALSLGALAQQGEGYRTVHAEPPTVEGPVEVLEFFWYGCGACYQFAPLVDTWKADLPEGVVFKRVPAVLNPNWRLHGQAFYTAEALGVTEQMHSRIFNAIHQERNFLQSQADVRSLFLNNGVSAEDFDSAWNSFAVDSQLRRAERLAREYQVRATPSMVVGGHYVSDPRTAGGLRELLQLTDRLTESLQAQ